jgi:hypothetical protein
MGMRRGIDSVDVTEPTMPRSRFSPPMRVVHEVSPENLRSTVVRRSMHMDHVDAQVTGLRASRKNENA